MRYVVGGHALVELLEDTLKLPHDQSPVNGNSFSRVNAYVQRLAQTAKWDLRVVGWQENYGKYNLTVETNDLKVAPHLVIEKEL